MWIKFDIDIQSMPKLRDIDIMKITWITGRIIGNDLAGATEYGLCKSLQSLGNQITVISPDEEKIDFLDHHILFQRSGPKGFQTIIGANKVRKILKNDLNLINKSDLIMVDWRLIGRLNTILSNLSTPWCVIDRGPPAYDGLLIKIQKMMWKRNWQLSTRNKNCKGGLVVSSEHKKFIHNNISANINLGVVPAGTDTNFSNFEPKIPKKSINIIYAGRIDKKRGMEDIIVLSQNIYRLNIPATLTVVGEGDFSRELHKVAKNNPKLFFIGKKTRLEVWEILKKSHVGIMPMPNIEIWEMASPIKLAEYAAAGLLIIGQNHQGNKLGEYDYSLLLDNNWSTRSISLLNKIINDGTWKELSMESRKSAIKYNWDFIAKDVQEILDKWLI